MTEIKQRVPGTAEGYKYTSLAIKMINKYLNDHPGATVEEAIGWLEEQAQ